MECTQTTRLRACAYHVNKYEHRYRAQRLIVYCVFGWIINKLCCDCCVCYFVYIYIVTVMACTRTLTNNITSGRNKPNEQHIIIIFLFTAATQSNTRQSFATRSVVNKRVNAFIETLRQRCNKKATQYCPQTVDIGLCSVRSLGAHSEQCSFIKFMNSMCCGSSPYGSK